MKDLPTDWQKTPPDKWPADSKVKLSNNKPFAVSNIAKGKPRYWCTKCINKHNNDKKGMWTGHDAEHHRDDFTPKGKGSGCATNENDGNNANATGTAAALAQLSNLKALLPDFE